MTDKQEFDPQVIEQYKASLMQSMGVQAVGESIANGQPCLKVYFVDEATLNATTTPNSIGMPVVKVVSGTIRSQ